MSSTMVDEKGIKKERMPPPTLNVISISIHYKNIMTSTPYGQLQYWQLLFYFLDSNISPNILRLRTIRYDWFNIVVSERDTTVSPFKVLTDVCCMQCE